MYSIVLFDLDGTLTDPGIGITNSVMYALEKFGIAVEERASLYKFIGPPLLDSFMEFYGFDEEKANQAVIYYREYYKDKGIFENRVYDGIPELLKRLKAAGKRMILATSKPEMFAKQILEYFDLSQYFDLIVGSDLEGTRNTKGKVINHALHTYAGLTGQNMEMLKKQSVMIGDRHHDIDGAKENQIDSIGVLFGYGGREELEMAGATCVVEEPEDIYYVEKMGSLQ